ncbi:hypothetical protein GCK72_017080 [Caenorhabditis remanei]|uniref:Uncharacterized protein n=1 Tax=Caenorhabditis remanei TaxID=31234 RepID=A0A6A5G6B4_CAERE|nr:hypothetical protein GCK72_017080 [Caenorhabditis remanei]KAF1750530.1 hypothetical protein GCK72_017080 [Caenorhabditis remanei]
MSLYEESDGILETHVTWQDVESDLQKKLGTKATFGENKTAVNIIDMKVSPIVEKTIITGLEFRSKTSNIPENIVVHNWQEYSTKPIDCREHMDVNIHVIADKQHVSHMMRIVS